ncbi:hypothetical protein GCM10009798_09970 [Nocardioides panacihumi]|uniref:Ig-like domain repeat protein n=1 Tax=Nocardioides panacihumi TaxID=400774 RepID=A0ABN2QIG5_9ACTN
MSTLDDLRATLTSHALAEDTALPGRLDSVRSRVTVVRRRRRAATVAGAVAAIAVVAAGVALPRLVTTDGVPDLAASAHVTWGGFDYALVEELQSRPGDDRLDVTIPRSDRDQVVVLVAEDLHGGSVTLGTKASQSEGGELLDRLVEDGAGAPVSVTAAAGTDVSRVPLVATVDGGTSGTRVAVAVYRRTDAMPRGVLDATGATVFRQRVGGRELLAGAFVEPGRAERTFSFRGALSDVRLADFCSVPNGGSWRNGPWVHVSIDGDGFMSGSCGAPSEDATGSSYYPDLHEVKEHSARVWISTTQGGAPTPVAGAVVGLGLYGPTDTVDVHGSTIDRVVESAGRLWQLDHVIDSEPGTHRIVATWTNPRDHFLVGYAAERTRRVTIGGTVPGGGTTDNSAGSLADARSSSVGGVVLPGGKQSFTVTWPAQYADASGAILVYRPAD